MLSKLQLLLLVVLCLAITEVIGQEVEVEGEETYNEDVSMVEFTIDRLLLQNTFKNNIGRNLTGFSVSLLNQRSAPGYSFFGLNVNFVSIGSLSGTVNSGFDSFNDDTGSNFISALFIYRHYLPLYFKSIEPFFEVGIGPQFLYTSTTTTFFDSQGTSEINFEESDFGLAYGLDIGVTVKIVNQLFALVKFGFYGGTATTYLVPQEEVTTNFPVDSFDTRTSQTNYLKLQVGLAYAF